MAIFVFTLSLILAIAGFGGLFASVDLMPTEIGLLYAGCGVILISASFIVAAIGALIVRLGALASAVEDEVAAEDSTNDPRHLPTLHEMEEAIARPEAAPTLVGRYSAGGASYMIFSDGTIEAETSQGAYRFASMGDFKAFLSKNKEA